MKIEKRLILYTQLILFLAVTVMPSEAAFWNSKNKSLDTQTTQKEKPVVNKYRSVEDEAYSIMTGQPKVNPMADVKEYQDYEVGKDIKHGWFWQNRDKKVKTKKENTFKLFSKKNKKLQELNEQSDIKFENNETNNNNLDGITEQEETLPQDLSAAIFIKNIEITGNKLVPTSLVLESLQMHPGDLYTREIVQKNLKIIHDMGYFSEKIRAVPIIHDDENVTIRISVEENTPITGVTLTGNNSIPSDEIIEILMELVYHPQNVVKINETINKIQDLYAKKGYILARVSSVSDDPDGVVNVVIDEGIIKSIKVEGNKKTKDFVVNRNILVEPGCAYNEILLKQDLMRLYATQAFKDVTRTIEQDDEEPNKYNITIQLEEQRTGSLSLGGGLDTATGLFGTAGFGDSNFRGRGQRLQANFLAGTGTILTDNSMLNHANWQAEISFFEPKLFKTDNGLLSKIYYRDYASYQVPLALERRFGADMTLSRQFKTHKHLTGSVSLGVEKLQIREGDADKIQSLYEINNIPISKRAEQLSDGFFINLTPALVYDTRDSLIAPRHGTIASLRFEQAVGLSNLNDTHARLTGAIKQYMPIPHTKKAAFSLSARGGGKLYGDMPEALAYRVGGPYSVRGFKMSAVGVGEGFVMGSAEVLLPIPFVDRFEKLSFFDNMRFTIFADAGKVFNPTITDTLYDRPLSAITTGVGLKVYIPGVGPLSIDYGFPLTHTGRNASSSGTFTFSAGDIYY